MIICDKRCKVCPKFEGRRVLFSTVSKTPYTFHENFSCADTSVIYCIICDKCGKMYIGLTSNNLRTRFRAHRHFSVTKKNSRPIYRHFACASHDFTRDHRIVPLEHCEPDALPEREAFWIRTLHTLLPNGLNAAYGKPYYPYDKSLFPLGRNFLLIPSITFLHKPNPWCLRMANPEPLPQRATRISRRLRGQEPVLESCPARVVGSAATPPSGGLSPNGDNSNPSLHHF